MVVGAQHRLGGARGGYNEVLHGAQTEEHHVGAMLPCEAAERDVGEGTDEMEVPDDGQRRRRRREALPFHTELSGEPVMHRHEEEKEEEEK